MSYEVVRSAVVANDGTVTIKSASNNVWPRDPSTWQMTYRNPANPFTGKLGGEVEVFAGYEQGNFQGGSNRYTRQLEVLMHMPEYRAYDWRGHWEDTKDARDNDKRGYYELLAKALATPAPKPRFAITKQAYGGFNGETTVYFKRRKGAGFARWQLTPKGANLYRYRDDAEREKSNFRMSDNWQVMEVAA